MKRWAVVWWTSAAIHAVALVGALLWPQWRWALLVAVVLNHAVLTLAGLLPRCSLLGPNHTRLPQAAAARREVAITIDDGPDPQVTPAVLDILDAYGAKATFFVIGAQAQQQAQCCRELVRRGHDVQNHSQNHRHHFSLMGPTGMAREIAAAQETITHLTGRTPRFFRAPAGLRNPFLEPVLQRLGLRLVSWTRRAFDTRHADPDAVTAALLRNLRAGDIVLLHDRHGARMPDGRPVILAVLPRVLEAMAQAQLRPVTLTQAFDNPFSEQ